ncbi:UTP--glucose-1-phosphate uridylyltransferase GalU [Desulfolucanica intricata]|uniref:UTP--glucose-1-phosphate uridylyltransferase GalU n=1 Tax=Desulfolucanica intricata TaxID=1285191 RepID=UPI000833D75B|nr:UTP--glucose-1-phosphate uridylyltransferase GalU [Desulfolucanica intricata]
MKIRKAVIPAAGLGTRFLPVTKALPKEMLPIVDKPTIQYIIEEAVSSGIEDILIITGRGKWPIVDYFDRSPELEAFLESKEKTKPLEMIKKLSEIANIHYIRQNEPLGLGHAIYCAKTFVGNDPFAVLLGDDIVKSDIPALKQLIEVAEKENSSVIGIREVSASDVSKYGIIEPLNLNNDGQFYRVKDLVEKPAPEDAPSNLAITGRYILNASIFACLENLPPGAGGEIQLTDALKVLSRQEPVYACMFEGIRYDAGDKLGYLKATVEFALESPELGKEFSGYLDSLYEKRKGL